MGFVAVGIQNHYSVHLVEVAACPSGAILRRYDEVDFAGVHVGEVQEEQGGFTSDHGTALSPQHGLHQFGVLVEGHGRDSINPLCSPLKDPRRSHPPHLVITNVNRCCLTDSEQPMLIGGDLEQPD